MPDVSIVTLTMNPAVDISMEVDRIEPTHKLRCGPARRDAGGGGINVARAITRLGGSATAIFPAGGATGLVLEAMLRAENLSLRSIPIAGETREDFAVRETSTGRQYRFVVPGPQLNPSESKRCLDSMFEAICPHTIVVASGSLPPKLTETFYATAAHAVADRKVRFVLDSSGPSLRAALGRNVYLIKPSRRELEELVGEDLPDHRACLGACRRIVAEGGAEFVALSLGAAGAILVGREVALRATAPQVDVLSSVGAGDSFLGALVLEIASNTDLAGALKTAVAAGSAALLSPGTGLCEAKHVAALRPQVVVTDVNALCREP